MKRAGGLLIAGTFAVGVLLTGGSVALAAASFSIHWFRLDPPAVCKVSDEQKAKIKAIRNAWRKETRDLFKSEKAKYDELSAALKTAQERKDRPAIDKLKKDLAGVKHGDPSLASKEGHEREWFYVKRIRELLTPEQCYQWEEYYALHNIDNAFRGLTLAGLTEEQLARLKVAWKDIHDKKPLGQAPDATYFARWSQRHQELADETARLLTPEQSAKFSVNEIQRYGPGYARAGVKLAPDQVAKATSAWVQACKGKTFKDRNDMVRFAVEKLPPAVDAILTPAQKETMRDGHLQAVLARYYKKADLTQEQTDKIKAIWAEVYKDAPPRNLGKSASQLRTRIDALLTDQQKEAMKGR